MARFLHSKDTLGQLLWVPLIKYTEYLTWWNINKTRELYMIVAREVIKIVVKLNMKKIKD